MGTLAAITYPTVINYVNRATVLDETVPVKVRFSATSAGTAAEDDVEAGDVKFDLTDKFGEQIVPGSVNFTLGGRRYFDRLGSLYYGLDVSNGSANAAGSVNYSTGEVSLNSWQVGGSSAVGLTSLLTTLEGYPASSVSFRVPVAPVRPNSFQLLATKVAGGTINVTADADGDIDASGVHGKIDYSTGVVAVYFGTRMLAAGQESQPWYDADGVGTDGYIIRPEPVFADTIRFNAVSYTYLPLDADLLGLDPVRLPQDGKVPIFRPGSFAVIGHKKTTAPATVTNGQTVNLGRVRLSRVRVIGNNGSVISTGYTTDLEAGTVTFSNVTGYSQPVTIEDRVEDMLLVSDVQINGDLTFTRQITHNYPVPGSYVSSALVAGDHHARVSLMFDQATWNGTSFLDALTGSPATGTYNDILAPVEVTNIGAVTERWVLRFTSSTAFQVIGEHLGVIDTGTINADIAPINPATGEPYFTLREIGWGSGWATGNIVRMNTVGAEFPVWVVRTIQQGPETEQNDQFTLLIRGDVDAP